MKTSIGKDAVVALFCCCRQAERSVHYALSCPTQWSKFVDYYDEDKRQLITDAIALLKEAGADASAVVSVASFTQPIVVTAVMVSVARLVVNRFKKAWTFSRDELSLIASAFEHLNAVVRRQERAGHQELQDLRRHFLDCQRVIEGRLIGVSELRRAGNIEHFLQSEYVEHVTLEQMGVRASLNGKGTRRLVSS